MEPIGKQILWTKISAVVCWLVYGITYLESTLAISFLNLLIASIFDYTCNKGEGSGATLKSPRLGAYSIWGIQWGWEA